MTRAHEALIKTFACSYCAAEKGKPCLNKESEAMPRDVHPARMTCPLCKKPYAERSGSGFRHDHEQGGKWCRLPKEFEVWRCQFCEKEAPAPAWKDNKCPHCAQEYDCILAQEGDD